MRSQSNLTRRIALAGMLTALAMVLSYVEALIPFNFGIPGVKLGLANIIVVTGLYYLPLPEVCVISAVRIILSSLLFGNMMALAYSLAGGALSLVVMVLLKRTGKFSVAGISMAGGVFHNVGQILAAMLLTGVGAVAYYMPVLMGVGLVTGLFMGLLSGRVMLILAKTMKKQD